MDRMRSGRLCFLILVAGLAAVASAGVRPSTQTQPSQWHGPFFFIQLSDTQLGMQSQTEDVTPEAAKLSRAVDDINRLKPAFVIITGDLTQRVGDPRQIAAFRGLIGRIRPSIPVHLVAGNHDVGDVPTEASLAAYRRTFGPDWYAFNYGGCHFVVYDTEIICHPEHVPGEMARQLAWLKKDLASPAAQQAVQVFAFGHHPLFTGQAEEPDGHNNIPLARRGIYVQLFAKADLTAVFCGHIHHNAVADSHGVLCIATGPIAVPLGLDPPGLRVVKVYATRMQHEYLSLDQADRLERVHLAPATRPATQPVPAAATP